MKQIDLAFVLLWTFIGSGAVARSYVTSATTEQERTGALAGVSASQAVGFILGPGRRGVCDMLLASSWPGMDILQSTLALH